MNFTATIILWAGRIPAGVTEWLEQEPVLDMTVCRNKIRGRRTVEVTLKASTLEDLEAKRKSFNHMLETAGYGIEANK